MTVSHVVVQQPAASASARRMAAMLAGMGALHFVAPKPFDSIVPAELPGNTRYYTYASGVAEVGTAALIAVPATRRVGALAAVALFVAVFPANLNTVRLWWGKSWPLRAVAIARLPLQVPMITWAWKIYRSS